MDPSEKLLSIVLPAHNEQDNILPMAKRLAELLGPAGIRYEVLFVSDGSTDQTWQRIRDARAQDPAVRGVRLSRSFGKEAAIFAGLSAANGDCCAVLDADFQHPPEKILDMWQLWCNGAEIVEGVKRQRGEESHLHGAAAKVFYRLLSRAAGTDLQRSSDFKLLDRKAVLVLRNLPERDTFFRALSAWVGFTTATVEYDVQPRAAGQSNWTTPQLIAYALSDLASFTTAPLRLVYVLGVVMLLLTLVLGTEAFVRWLVGGALEGFTTVILLELLIGSLLMISLGIIGYYLSKIYDEVKHRPRYVIAETVG